MQIVIDIPKDDFEKIKNISFVENTETMLHQSSEDRKGTMMLFRVMDAIKEGTPLPKGHGRLGDLDALEEYFRNVRKELKASDYKNGIEFFVRDEMLLNVQQFIHLCDAIIEGSDSE
jgi:hypothetical protein